VKLSEKHKPMAFIWYVGQILGIVAFMLSIIALMRVNDSAHRLANASGAFIDAIHWVLLGAYTAGMIALLISARVMTAELVQNKPLSIKMLSIAFFCMLFIAAAFITWQDNYSSLPLIASVAATFAFMTASRITLRIWLFLCNIPWIIYSVHVGSIGGILSAILAMAILAHTMLRMYK
jgi:hypothetical protein